MLPHLVLTSNAYRACSPNARALLVELAMLYNGENNGSLYMSVRDAAARMGVSDLTAASNAFEELQDRGLIVVAKEAHFEVKASDKSRARCWRLTWLQAGRRAASNGFLDPKAEPSAETRERRRMERGQKALKAYRKSRDADKLPVMDSDTMDHFEAQNGAGAVMDSNTANRGNGQIAPNAVVMDSATYLYATRGSTTVYMPQVGWWAPDWSHVAAVTAYAAILASQAATKPSKTRMPPSKNQAAPQILAKTRKSAELANLKVGVA